MMIRFSVLILLYSLARVLFFAFNQRALQGTPLSAVAAAFVVGFRSDVIVIVLTNSVLIVLALLRPFVIRAWYEKFLNVVFLLCNLPFLIINVVDLEYFKFTGERSSLSLWDVRSDIPFQLGNFIIYYWYLSLIAVGFIFFACFFLPNGAAKDSTPPHRKWLWGACGFLLGGLLLLGGEHVVKEQIAGAPGSGDDSALKQLAQNSTLTLLRSGSSCTARSIGGEFGALPPTGHEVPARPLVNEPVTHSRAAGAADNVVILIVESLSTEYTGIGGQAANYAPFLTQLADKSVSFANHFANARRSIDALPSILLGLPRLSAATFRCSTSRRLDGLPSILREHGYATLFFHGGRNGAGDFDAFTKQIGFTHYYGANEYGRPADFDGIWGIYDEPFLRFTAHELSKQDEPFAAVIFTTSTHQPFKIPAQYEGRFPKGELPIHESVGYVDHSLRQFFAIAEQMPWFDRTLFVITGDHTGPAAEPRSRLVDAYRVPLIFYHPTVALPDTDESKITQHVDIAASVLDHLGLESGRLLPFGRSVFDAKYEGVALGEVAGRYWIALGDHYMERSAGDTAILSYLSDDTATLDDPAKIEARLLRELEIYVLRFNQLFKERPRG
jgi:hypothetical protein